MEEEYKIIFWFCLFVVIVVRVVVFCFCFVLFLFLNKIFKKQKVI